MLTPKPWKPERVIWLFASLLACIAMGTLVVQGYLWAISKDDGKAPPTVWVMLLGTMMTHGLTLVLVGVFLREHRISWREAFGIKSEGIVRTLSLAVLTTGIVLPIALSLSWLSKKALIVLFREATPQQAVVLLQQTVSIPQQVYYAFMTIIAAPIVEEIIFRGVLYPSIKQQGYARTAAWVTSILFAWSHVNLMIFVPLLFLGFVLTLLYETTDNLLAPIVAHALFNATNFVMITMESR
jgi:membrane protease YdiL (CAAX protease family)